MAREFAADAEPGLALRPAVPGDDQHRHEQRVAAGGLRVGADGSQGFIVRGGAGVFFDRVPLRAVANALLSAGNTTDVTQLRQPQVSGILPTQAGAPVFPNILPDRLPSTALVSITTMDKGLQNAYRGRPTSRSSARSAAAAPSASATSTSAATTC